MPVVRSIALRNSPPFSASRVALVAAARISSTWCERARRSNFDSACSAEVIGLVRQLLAVQAAGAQPDHFLLAIDDFEREIGADPDDDHVNGIGADVDGCQAHGA